MVLQLSGRSKVATGIFLYLFWRMCRLQGQEKPRTRTTLGDWYLSWCDYVQQRIIDFEEPVVYWDNVSGKPLKPEKVRAARLEECEVIETMGVWEVIPRPKNEKVITTRWVDVNKGDEIKEKYRSRFVVQGD